jgi:hypothetical protein
LRDIRFADRLAAALPLLGERVGVRGNETFETLPHSKSRIGRLRFGASLMLEI